jgi:hypothetical protein
LEPIEAAAREFEIVDAMRDRIVAQTERVTAADAMRVSVPLLPWS